MLLGVVVSFSSRDFRWVRGRFDNLIAWFFFFLNWVRRLVMMRWGELEAFFLVGLIKRIFVVIVSSAVSRFTPFSHVYGINGDFLLSLFFITQSASSYNLDNSPLVKETENPLSSRLSQRGL